MKRNCNVIYVENEILAYVEDNKTNEKPIESPLNYSTNESDWEVFFIFIELLFRLYVSLYVS